MSAKNIDDVHNEMITLVKKAMWQGEAKFAQPWKEGANKEEAYIYPFHFKEWSP